MEQPSSNPKALKRQFSSRLLPVLLLLAGSSCGLIRAPAPRLTPPMPVQAPLRKQVLQGYMPFGSIGWVNNTQVVFHGFPAGPKAGKNSLYLWDLTGKPRLLLSDTHGSCITKGTISTSQLSSNGEAKMFKLNQPGFSPQQRPPKPAPRISTFDPVSCSWIARPDALRDHKWEALRRGDGFLDFTPDGRQIGPLWAVEHLDADARTRRDTGIRMPKPMLPMAVHAAHDDSYLVFDLHLDRGDAERWIKANNRTIWRLDHQRRGRAIALPAGPWVGLGGGTISFLPSRPGVLITSNNFARDYSPGGAGLYLLQPGAAAQRLERGLVEEIAVSPDGCRLAYGFRPRLDTGIPEGGPRLVVLDLCTAKSNRSNEPESR
jgi:hypothetical protein